MPAAQTGCYVVIPIIASLPSVPSPALFLRLTECVLTSWPLPWQLLPSAWKASPGSASGEFSYTHCVHDEVSLTISLVEPFVHHWPLSQHGWQMAGGQIQPAAHFINKVLLKQPH